MINDLAKTKTNDLLAFVPQSPYQQFADQLSSGGWLIDLQQL